jgi:hypothetical protein
MSGNFIAASGVSSDILGLLAEPRTAAEYITQRCHAEAPWMEFTHTATMDKLRPGDVLKFITVDGEFDFKHKEYNAAPVYEQIEAGAICARMCAPRELGFKVDTEMIKGREAEYMRMFDMSLSQSLMRYNQTLFRQAVQQLLTGADAQNQGYNAGVYGGLALGSQANPLIIDVSSGNPPEAIYRQILDVILALQSAQSQRELGNCIDSWKLLVHKELIINFAHAQSMAHCCDMSKSVLVSGVNVFDSLFGMNALISPLMPRIATPTGFKTPIIITHSQASAFYGGITSAYMDEEMQMRKWLLTETRGGVVLRPEHIFVAWVEIRR